MKRNLGKKTRELRKKQRKIEFKLFDDQNQIMEKTKKLLYFSSKLVMETCFVLLKSVGRHKEYGERITQLILILVRKVIEEEREGRRPRKSSNKMKCPEGKRGTTMGLESMEGLDRI